MIKEKWLRGEIDSWRKEGLICASQAESLLARYPIKESGLSWGAMLAGAFGAVLTGLGIIALFAANWDCFNRAERAIIASLPFLICGLVAVIACYRKWKTMLLWEPLGILWSISVIAAVCLVAQTYQVGGSVPGLILFVALLILPIVWISRSVALISFWPIFPIVWGISIREGNGPSWSLVFESLAFMSLSVPGYIAFLRRRPNRATLISGQIFTGIAYTFGSALMICVLAPEEFMTFQTGILVFWLCSLAVIFVAKHFVFPIWKMIAILIMSVACASTVFTDLVFYFVSVIFAGVVVWRGIRSLKLSYINIGTILMAYLILVKFFESRVSFVFKGVVLILAGILLTCLNVVMLRFKRRGGAT